MYGSRKAKRILAISVVVAVLLLALPLAVSAELGQPGIEAAAERMKGLELVKGNEKGDLLLNNSITRAEMVTIIVRAFGYEELAGSLKGAPAFPDTTNHPWASGYIAAAKQLMEERSGAAVGRLDGTFDPNGKVTAAESIAFLMKFIGIKVDASLSWPDNYIQAGAKAGMLTEEDAKTVTTIKNSPASRGLVFYFSDYAFDNYKLENQKTIYEMYDEAPVVEANAAPVFSGVSSYTAKQGNLLTIPLSELFTDPDSDELSFVAQTSNTGAVLQQSADSVKFMATASGQFTITVEANDGTHKVSAELTVSVTNLTAPSVENIHIVSDFDGTRVNVLYPASEITKVVVYDKAEGGNILGQSSEITIFEGGDETIPYYSSRIAGGFPANTTHVYVFVYDKDGNSVVVEKPIH